ncbi:carboxymuconolactone decarboxylase family protein [Rhodococcus fascians]|nr:carboxymuconolactone decarboxylase family protein [Rhodococcus fascians]
MTETTNATASVDQAHKEIFDAGIVIRKEVIGADYVEAALTKNAGTDGEALQQYVSEYVWGSVWSRPGLDRRSRSLLNLGMLVALNQHHELSVHVRGALNNGLTRDEIVESIIHATAYCGAPAGLAAMRVAQETLTKELGPRTDEAKS